MKKYLLPLTLSTLLATGSAAFAATDNASTDGNTIKIFNNTSSTLDMATIYSGADLMNASGKFNCNGIMMASNHMCASITPDPEGSSVAPHSSKTFTVNSAMSSRTVIHGAIGFQITADDASTTVTVPVDVSPVGAFISDRSNRDSDGDSYVMGEYTSSSRTETPAFISSVVYFNDNGQTSTTVIVNDNPMAQKA